MRGSFLCLLLSVAAYRSAAAQEQPITPARIAAMRRALRDARDENSQLKKQHAEKKRRFSELVLSHRTAIDRQLKTLLSSDDPQLQLAGLRLLLLDPGSLRNLGAYTEPAGSYSPNVEQELLALQRSSDATTRRLAIEALMIHCEEAAARLGYQVGYTYWRPVSDPRRTPAREVMDALTRDLPVRDDYTLAGIADEVTRASGVTLKVDPKFEKEVYKFRKVGHSLEDLVEMVLEPRGVTVLIAKDHLELLGIDEPRAAVTETYNIRGVIERGLPLQQVLDVLRKSLDEQCELTASEPHKIIVTGRYTQQRKTSEVLGMISPTVNIAR